MKTSITKFEKRLKFALNHQGLILRQPRSLEQTISAQSNIELLERTERFLEPGAGESGWDSVGQGSRRSRQPLR